MRTLKLLAAVLVSLFVAGQLIGIKKFSRRPKTLSTMWTINAAFASLWFVTLTLLFFEKPSGVLLTFILSFLWFLAQLRAHWIPYVLGAPEEYQREYRMIFDKHISFLPRITRRGIVPDLYHTLILILLITTILTSLRAMFS